MNYNRAINGEIINFDLNKVFELKEKLLPKFIFNEDIEEIRISPDGKIYKLPFSALILEKTNHILNPPIFVASRGISKEKHESFQQTKLNDIKWLNDKYKITYVPSILKFKDPSLKIIRKYNFLGVGDPQFRGSIDKYEGKSFMLKNLKPLPDTREEIKSIANLFKEGNKTLLLGKNASKSNFMEKQKSNNYNIIVFATHGFMTSELSRLSEPGLALSNFGNQDTEDGYLSSSEIISLNLKADGFY